jgi:hypothetical protein
VAGHNPLGSGWSLVSPFMPFLQQVSGVLHAAVSVMQKAIGIMVLAALGWADDAAYLDLKAYPEDRFLLGSFCRLDQTVPI